MLLSPRLIAALAALVVTGGAATLWAPWADTSDPEPSVAGPVSATYEVTGDLSLYGLDPPPNGTELTPDRITVTLDPEPTTVLDQARQPATAVNLTIRAGQAWATHWIHPGTGDLVVVTVPDKREHYHFGHAWSWRHSGEPAQLGLTNGWPQRVDLGTGTLVLGSHTAVPPDALASDQAWAPPGPPEDVAKAMWNRHHPPSGKAETVTPLERAIQGARENDPSLDRWLDNHPDWQVVFGSYDFKESMVSRGEWSLEFHDRNGDRTARTVEESIYTEGQMSTPPVRTYEVETDDPQWPSSWSSEEDVDLVGLTDAWARMTSWVGGENVIRRAFSQDAGEEGATWTARIYYTGIKQGDTRLLERVDLDMETGELLLYTGWQSPEEALGLADRSFEN